ncbi:MAG: hypothetical protein OXU78_01005 [Deltaproteobacteria bacterium]|nr:hypothetical protein [Deltaproteobacteria bacterium]
MLGLAAGCATNDQGSTKVKLPSGAIYDQLSGETSIELEGTDPNAGSKRFGAFMINVLAGTSINSRDYEHTGNIRVECSEDKVLKVGLYAQAGLFGGHGDAGQTITTPMQTQMTTQNVGGTTTTQMQVSNPLDVQRKVSMPAIIDGNRHEFVWVGKGFVADGLVHSQNPEEDAKLLLNGENMRLRFQKETAKVASKDVVFDLTKYRAPLRDVVSRCGIEGN